MPQCTNEIFKNISSTCSNRTVAGIEQIVYLMNRDDIQTITYDGDDYNKVTGITLKTGKLAYTAKGFKKNMTCGFERNISDDTVDTFTNSLTLTGYQFDAEGARNFDNMGNIVAIVDRKGTKAADGSVILLGLENGLFVSADSWAAGDNNGARTITLSSLADAGESCSYYVYTVSEGSPAQESYGATIGSLESMLA